MPSLYTKESLLRDLAEEKETLKRLESGLNDYGSPVPKRGRVAQFRKDRILAVKSYIKFYENKLINL